MREKKSQGVERIEFYDHYDRWVILAQSGKPAREIVLFHGPFDGPMALDRGAAQRLVNHIQAWIDTGSFELSKSGE